MAAVHPSGEGLVVLPGATGKQDRIKLLHVPPDKPPQAPSTLASQRTGTPLMLTSSLETGLCVVSLARKDFGWRLLVARPVGHGFELVHEREAPSMTTLVQDARARAVVAYSTNPPGLALINGVRAGKDREPVRQDGESAG